MGGRASADAIPNGPGLHVPAWFGSDLDSCLDSVLIPNRNPLDSDQNLNRITLNSNLSKDRLLAAGWYVPCSVGCCGFL